MEESAAPPKITKCSKQHLPPETPNHVYKILFVGDSGVGKEKKVGKQMEMRRKYLKLRRLVKQQVFINAALFDEVASMEQQFLKLKNERRFLLKKLFKHLPMTESQVLQSTRALNAVENSHPGKIPQTMFSPVQPGGDKQVLNMKRKSVSSSKQARTTSQSPVSKKATSTEELDKPKRKKPGTAKKKVQPLHMNELNIPLFPITLGTLTIYDLGQILPDKPGFHSERYIWPVGYCSTRVYPSMLDPDRRIQYFCYIKDGGADPTFEIIAEDEPDKPITAVTATACHCIVLKRLNKAREKTTTNTGSGPEFFGFSHSTIQYLIQCLPGSEKCEKYVHQRFEMPAPTQSTTSSNVIRDGNLPNMENYDRTSLELPRPQKT